MQTDRGRGIVISKVIRGNGQLLGLEGRLVEAGIAIRRDWTNAAGSYEAILEIPDNCLLPFYDILCDFGLEVR